MLFKLCYSSAQKSILRPGSLMRLPMHLAKVKAAAQSFYALSRKTLFPPDHVQWYVSASSPYKSISHPALGSLVFHFPDAMSCLLTVCLTPRISGLGRTANQDSNSNLTLHEKPKKHSEV